MAESVQSMLVPAVQVAREVVVRKAPNGVNYGAYGDTTIPAPELDRMVQAVPALIAGALTRKTYYFVPLAMNETQPDGRLSSRSDSPDNSGHRSVPEPTLVASVYSPGLVDQAICHRNVSLEDTDGVFISTRLLSDRFALAFEFFINVGHAFVDAAGVPASFTELVWNQALADVRGETSQDAWESRNLSLAAGPVDGKPRVDEKAKNNYLESAFSDAVAIYQLSLSVDFDYSELREREYPLLAPQALAERLRLAAKLFPPNPNYEFAIRYRRRA
jgi:hypothetical protein